MTTLLNQSAFDLIKKYHIPTSDYAKIEHASHLKNTNYPIVLKIDSPKILHKTEQKAIRICKDYSEAQKNFHSMRKIGPVIAQKFVEGRELILGIKKDPAFGQVIMFGLGGIFTEVMKDVSFRVCPITNSDAKQMIEEIKGKKILEDFRGKKSVDKSFLAEVLVNLSKLAVKENVSELDINPFTIKEGKNGKAVDCRIILI